MISRALKIVESLNLVSIVCVVDQAIYSKASEIKWKEEEKFRCCVLMMGMFHMLMMFMHILSKRFADAGVLDVLIQSGVIAEGSVDRALCGKMYNRGIRMYKLVDEAITRGIFQSIHSSQDTEQGEVRHLYLDNENIDFDDAWAKKHLKNQYKDFTAYRERIKAGQPLQQFWINFLELFELLLSTIYSIRS